MAGFNKAKRRVAPNLTDDLLYWYTFSPSDLVGGVLMNKATSVADAQMRSSGISTDVVKKGTGSLYANETNGLDCFKMPAFTTTSDGYSISLWLMVNTNIAYTRGFEYSNNYANANMIYLNSTILQYENSGTINIGSLPLGTWVHISISVSSTTHNLYMNGELKNTTARELVPRTYADCLLGGSRQSGTRYNIYVSDYRVYKKPITQNMVTAIYNWTEA